MVSSLSSYNFHFLCARMCVYRSFYNYVIMLLFFPIYSLHCHVQVSGGSGASREMDSERRRSYRREYGNQDDLNYILNKWVKEVEEAYFDLDFAIHQEADEEGENIDYDLPKGSEFQELLKQFVKFEKDDQPFSGRHKPNSIEDLQPECRRLVSQLEYSLQLIRQPLPAGEKK